jgi:hypothetical protein
MPDSTVIEGGTEPFVPTHVVTPFDDAWRLGQANEKVINNAVRELLLAVREMQDYMIRNYG